MSATTVVAVPEAPEAVPKVEATAMVAEREAAEILVASMRAASPPPVTMAGSADRGRRAYTA